MKFVAPPVRVRVIELPADREDVFARAWETVLRLGREARERAGAAPAEARK